MGPYGLKYLQREEGNPITGLFLYLVIFPTHPSSALPTPLHMPLHSNIWYSVLLVIVSIFPGPTMDTITDIYCTWLLPTRMPETLAWWMVMLSEEEMDEMTDKPGAVAPRFYTYRSRSCAVFPLHGHVNPLEHWSTFPSSLDEKRGTTSSVRSGNACMTII